MGMDFFSAQPLISQVSAVGALWPPLKRALNRTRKGIRIHPLQISLTIGGQVDPAAGEANTKG